MQEPTIKHEEIFKGKWYFHPPMRNALAAAVLTGLIFGLNQIVALPRFIEIVGYCLAIILGGYHWVWEGIDKLIKEKKVGIEVLMMAATLGSAVLGLWDEAAALVVLYGLAEGIEEYTFAKTRNSIRSLLDLAPQEARILLDNTEKMIPAVQLKLGDIFFVKPGEAIPTDGIIVKGQSSVNEAPLTGESLPVDKQEGMKVFAATLNHEGALEVRVTATFENNSLQKMIHLVEEAQAQKGKTQIFIEKFGNIYSPLVLLSAALMLLIPAVLGLSLAEWGIKSVLLLVAAAPCALVMSTPVAIAAGIGSAGKHGVLIKGGAHLESLGKIKVIAFDKTGTLTHGKPIVTDIIPLQKNEAELLSFAYTVERYSEHPLAQAIVEKVKEKNVPLFESSEFVSITGFGAKAKIAGESILVGKPGLFKNIDFDKSLSSTLEKLRQEAKTVLLVGTDSEIWGIIALRDEIRPQIKEIIQELHRQKIKLVMLTGDNLLTAQAIAKEIDIDEVKADLLPSDKVAAISELEDRFGAVAMVGDGINDAPALARATVGIAMGTVGSDAAIEAADIALMADDLNKLNYALKLGKKARKISVQNITFSLLLLSTLIPLALLGFLGVGLTIFFHEGSELLAVANGLRVRNKN